MLTIPRAIILKYENLRILRKICVSAWSLTMRTRDFRSLRLNIFAKPFLPVHMGPSLNILRKKIGRKSRDTVPLTN